MVIKVIEKLVPAGQSSITFTDSECDDTMIYDVFVNDLQLFPTDVTVSEHTVTINFKDATQDNLYIKIVVNALEGSLDASDIPYDATDTSLTSDNVEDAIDELDNNISANVADIEQLQLDVVAAQGDISDLQTSIQNLNAGQISFDNTLSGMISDDVQGAIEEAYNHGGGSQEVYDDTEREIGTWFGKPLYRKVFKLTLTQSVTNTFIDLFTFTDGNIVKIDGYMDNGSSYYVPLSYLYYYSGNILGSAYRVQNNKIQVGGIGTDWNNWNYTFIIEYTKSTD